MEHHAAHLQPPQALVRSVTGTLPVATLLIAGGGFLDSYAWLEHGHVFTNAITGNIVLFGVSAAQGEWPQALRHVPPTLAFFAGVFAAQWLGRHGSSSGWLSAPVLSLGFEMAVLATLGVLLAGVPDMPVVVGIAFVAAMQNASFQRIEAWSYASVVTTGNARSATEAFYAGVFPLHDPGARHKAWVFGTICAGFAAGAFMGAVLTTWFGRAAILFPVALQVLALLSLLREGPQRSQAGLPQTGGRIGK